MKILMVGPQGCGKGTIGEKLSEKFGLPLISVGQLLRDLPETSTWYEDIHKAMNTGNLAPNSEVADIIRQEVKKEEYKNGFIMDGWARQKDDLDKFDPNFDLVILLNISEPTSITRLSTRRTCENCGKVYNLIFKPPKVSGICDACMGTLIQRDDDKEEAIRNRLLIFHKITKPVLDMYRKSGKLLEVDAEPPIEVVFDNTLKALAKIGNK